MSGFGSSGMAYKARATAPANAPDDTQLLIVLSRVWFVSGKEGTCSTVRCALASAC